MVLKGIFSESMYGCVLTCQIQGSSIVLTALSKGTILAKKHWFFAKKKADISKIKRALVLKGIFSESMYECVLTCQISSF